MSLVWICTISIQDIIWLNWGRFASADSYVQTGQGMLDKNMFAYCGNNPVNISDPTGNIWNWLKDKWEGFVSLFKKSKNRDTNISRSDVRGTFKNFSTVEADENTMGRFFRVLNSKEDKMTCPLFVDILHSIC